MLVRVSQFSFFSLRGGQDFFSLTVTNSRTGIWVTFFAFCRAVIGRADVSLPPFPL